MDSNSYKYLNNLLKEVNELCDKFSLYKYRGIDLVINNKYDIFGCLREFKDKATLKLKLIDKIKKNYEFNMNFDEADLNVLNNNKYLVWSKKGINPLRIYNEKAESIEEIGKYSTVLAVYPYDGSCIVAERNNITSKDCNSIYIINGIYENNIKKDLWLKNVKTWEYLSDNLIVFRTDISCILYNINSKKILLDNVESIKKIDEKIGNYYPNENYLVEKKLHINEGEINLKFFIDNKGHIVSNVIDSNNIPYRVEFRDNCDKYNNCLKQLYEFIIKDYTERGYCKSLKK